jgi:uncharacterized membrane protein
MENRDTARLETFSDGVFAISITLLSLDLKLPITNDKVSLMWGLIDLWPVYLAFIVSFFTLLMMWYIHSVYFKFINKLNKEIFYSNGLILMLTVSIPFVTRLVAEYMLKNSADTAISIYTAFGPLIALAYFWLIDAICRAKANQNPEVPYITIKKVRNKIAIGPFAYSTAFILSFFLPYAALVVCTVINVFWAFTRLEFKPEKPLA